MYFRLHVREARFTLFPRRLRRVEERSKVLGLDGQDVEVAGHTLTLGVECRHGAAPHTVLLGAVHIVGQKEVGGPAASLLPTSVDVEGSGAVLEAVLGDGALQGLPSHDDDFVRGLEGRPPSRPSLRLVCLGFVRFVLSGQPGDGPAVVSAHRQHYSRGQVTLAPLLRVPLRAALWTAPRRLVEPRTDRMALGEPGAIRVVDAVPNLEPGVLNGARHAVVRPRAAEREQMSPRLEDTEHFGPCLHTEGNVASVPHLAHEALGGPSVDPGGPVALGGCRVLFAEPLDDARQMVGRVAHDGVDRSVRQTLHGFGAVVTHEDLVHRPWLRESEVPVFPGCHAYRRVRATGLSRWDEGPVSPGCHAVPSR